MQTNRKRRGHGLDEGRLAVVRATKRREEAEARAQPVQRDSKINLLDFEFEYGTRAPPTLYYVQEHG